MTCDAPWSISLSKCNSEWINKCTVDPLNGQNGNCIEFVRQEIKRGRGTMDKYVKNFCAISDDPKCSCVSIPNKVESQKNEMTASHGPMYCWYKECTIDKLLTLELYKDASDSACIRPHCRLSADDFDDDGTHTICPENIMDSWYKPLDLAQFKRHTAFLTEPMFKK